jgi:hypothetical protein
VFGLALGLYLVGVDLRVLIAGDVATAIIGTAIVAIALCLWASKAPRGAAVPVTVLAAIDILIVVAGLPVGAWWTLVSIPLQIAAVALAVRARRLGSEDLADQSRRESAAWDYEHQERWRLGS